MAGVCRFDDSLPRLVKLLVDKLGRERISAGVVLRDATGRLSFFSDAALEPTTVREIEQLAGAVLGVYARPERVVAGATDPGAERVLNDVGSLDVAVRFDDSDDTVPIRYLDRRIVGTDWLRLPAESQNPGEGDSAAEGKSADAQRVVFASLKGGVGRSTALTVVAAEQARRGRNVLVIDLDLEAPGIGSLLLSSDRTPNFGVIDYLVERNFGKVERAIVDDMIGTSALTQGQGLVSVAPAVGSRTLRAPGNYLAKLSRAMIEAVDDDGPLSLAGKLLEMLTDLEAQRRYDLVLIDARAGLAEVTAGPLLALDAEILIFATDQVQTLQDLEFLFAHLGSLTGAARPAYWDRLKMVHAKAAQAARINGFRDALWDLFSTYLYVETLELEEFNFDADAPEAPHYPLVIPLDTAFADWDPVSNPDKLMESYYARTFETVIAYVDDLISMEQRDAQD
jgi:cellulose biosynthesis protein BcsQ